MGGGCWRLWVSSHDSSRCNSTANICTGTSWREEATVSFFKRPRLHTHKPRSDSSHGALFSPPYSLQSFPSLLHLLSLLLLPANPFTAEQLPRCILATCDIVEVKLNPLCVNWTVCVCVFRGMGAHGQPHSSLCVSLLWCKINGTESFLWCAVKLIADTQRENPVFMVLPNFRAMCVKSKNVTKSPDRQSGNHIFAVNWI